MIAILVYGLVALAVLAVLVGLFDNVQASRLRSTARARRAAWERRLVATPDDQLDHEDD